MSKRRKPTTLSSEYSDAVAREIEREIKEMTQRAEKAIEGIDPKELEMLRSELRGDDFMDEEIPLSVNSVTDEYSHLTVFELHDVYAKMISMNETIDFMDGFNSKRRSLFLGWLVGEARKELQSVRNSHYQRQRERDIDRAFSQINSFLISSGLLDSLFSKKNTEEKQLAVNAITIHSSKLYFFYQKESQQKASERPPLSLLYSMAAWSKKGGARFGVGASMIATKHHLFSIDSVLKLVFVLSIHILCMDCVNSEHEGISFVGMMDLLTRLIETNDVLPSTPLLVPLYLRGNLPMPSVIHSMRSDLTHQCAPSNPAPALNSAHSNNDTRASHRMENPLAQYLVVAPDDLPGNIDLDRGDTSHAIAAVHKILNQELLIHTPGMPAKEMAQRLNDRFPWMAPITRYLTDLVHRHQCHALDTAMIPPTILVGEPGFGKTSYLRLFTELAGLGSLAISMSGMRDNMAFRGSSKNWANASPSRITQLIADAGQANPVVILDEIEKAVAGSKNGCPYAALLQLFEPSDSSHFFDEFLSMRLNLSRVNYLATANSVDELFLPLRSRVKVLRAPKPTKDDYLTVFRRKWFAHFTQIGLVDAPPAFDEQFMRQLFKSVKNLREANTVFEIAIKKLSLGIPELKMH